VFWQNEEEWARTAKPLYEMQIEVCLRAIQQWPAVSGTVAGKEGRRHTYTSDEKMRFVEAVTKEVAELSRLKRPVFIEPIVPGVAAPSGWEGFDAETAKEAARELAAEKGGKTQRTAESRETHSSRTLDSDHFINRTASGFGVRSDRNRPQCGSTGRCFFQAKSKASK
jgi:hypothetical protein